MSIYDQISDFFCDLCKFANERHLLLTTRARGKTAPLAAELAQRELEQATQMYDLSTALKNTLFPEDGDEEYGVEQHEVSSRLIYGLASKLMDSCDIHKLVFGLTHAKEFLRRDVLMDSVAVELIDNPTHRVQLEESARLYVHVSDLLKSPELTNIEPHFETPPIPWIRVTELKTDTKLQLYAFQQLSHKKARILESLTDETSANIITDTDEVKSPSKLSHKQ